MRAAYFCLMSLVALPASVRAAAPPPRPEPTKGVVVSGSLLSLVWHDERPRGWQFWTTP